MIDNDYFEEYYKKRVKEPLSAYVRLYTSDTTYTDILSNEIINIQKKDSTDPLYRRLPSSSMTINLLLVERFSELEGLLKGSSIKKIEVYLSLEKKELATWNEISSNNKKWLNYNNKIFWNELITHQTDDLLWGTFYYYNISSSYNYTGEITINLIDFFAVKSSEMTNIKFNIDSSVMSKIDQILSQYQGSTYVEPEVYYSSVDILDEKITFEDCNTLFLAGMSVTSSNYTRFTNAGSLNIYSMYTTRNTNYELTRDKIMSFPKEIVQDDVSIVSCKWSKMEKDSNIDIVFDEMVTPVAITPNVLYKYEFDIPPTALDDRTYEVTGIGVELPWKVVSETSIHVVIEMEIPGYKRAAIRILGNRYNVTEMNSQFPIINKNGTIFSISNSLISEPQSLIRIKTHIDDWYRKNNVFDLEILGTPLFELMDIIKVQIYPHDDTFYNCTILDIDTSYNGGLTTKLILKEI